MSDDKGNNIRSHHFTRDTLYQILAFLIKRSTCGSSEISPWHGQTSLGLDYFFSFFCRTICPSHRLLASWRTFILLFPLCFLIHNNTFIIQQVWVRTECTEVNRDAVSTSFVSLYVLYLFPSSSFLFSGSNTTFLHSWAALRETLTSLYFSLCYGIGF